MTLNIHLNSLISATSNVFSCAFFTAHVSSTYIIAGLTTVLYTFPFTLKFIHRSHRLPIHLSSLSILIVFYASSGQTEYGMKESLPVFILYIIVYGLLGCITNTHKGISRAFLLVYYWQSTTLFTSRCFGCALLKFPHTLNETAFRWHLIRHYKAIQTSPDNCHEVCSRCDVFCTLW